MKPLRSPSPGVRRVVVVMPSIFTLANLFFGIWSIVLASRGDFYRAAWYIVIAGVLDLLDGLLARMSNTGTRFGAELDSLVDVVSFGVAPATLMYFLVFSNLGQFAWVFSYGFVVCAALRLARYNIQTADEHRGSFTGLPSPAAGMALATYYPFTETGFYRSQLAGLPWSQILIFLTIALSLAMVSNVRYARLPRIGLRSVRGLAGLGINLTILGFGIWERDIFFFPFGIAYVSYGLLRAAVLAITESAEARQQSETQLVLHDFELRERARRREPSDPDEGAGAAGGDD
ncbi:MAG: CDP-diacylglycerol--serine O-phosphatidyltransferase [Gemmatimonadetes bacterium]|nr:CDP-diacylglycerol--serine O-phosphatidyltransferase [Gemmatimonadota bacterium]